MEHQNKQKMTHTEFTTENALEIQKMQLNEWKTVLKTEAYNMLENAVMKRNTKIKTTYDVVRGTEIENILHNEVIKIMNK
jgi:hypothetical protein